MKALRNWFDSLLMEALDFSVVGARLFIACFFVPIILFSVGRVVWGVYMEALSTINAELQTVLPHLVQ